MFGRYDLSFVMLRVLYICQTFILYTVLLNCFKDYDNTILEPMAKASASSCAPPTDGATAFSVSSVYQTYLDVFVSWGSEVIGWHWDTQTCDIGFQCDNFRTVNFGILNFFLEFCHNFFRM